MSATNSPGTTEFTMPSDREVVVSRVFDAPRELLFDVHTKPEHVPNWMTGMEGYEMTGCEIDLRAGGGWRYTWRNAEGAEMSLFGEFREVDRPSRYVHTENWGEDWPELECTVEFTEEDGGTRVTTTILVDSLEDRDKMLSSGMSDGMEQTYGTLDEYLRSLT